MTNLSFKSGGRGLFYLTAAFLLASCSTTHYRQQADREAYGIIEEKSEAVPGMREDFDVEFQALELLAELPLAPDEARLPMEREELENARLLDLRNALRIAAVNSRDYQNRKESVFLQALSLSNERNRLQPQFFWRFSGGVDYDSDDDWSASGRSEPGVEWMLASGARLSAGLSTSASRFLSGDPASAARSVFDLTLTQPLLRQGRKTAIEPLTQAERDMVYELREFVRFQRRFTVGVLADYYRVLERRQRIENQQVNYDNLSRIRRRAEALSEAGRLPELQVARARQDELSARDSLELAQQDYYRALDELKVSLGIKPETEIILDPKDLEILFEIDMDEPPIGRDESIELALLNRLDLATARWRVDDAERKVQVAIQALRPGLDLVFGARASSEDNNPLSFSGGDQSGHARLEAGLPLERTNERNIYRRRLVEYQRINRDFQERRDQVVLEVTNRWRDFHRAVSSYEIQQLSVELAEERVESTEMLFDAGRATTRDVLDAHEDLLRAQNRLAQTLVDFRLASLELERDMDILVIDEYGQIQEGVGFHDYTRAEQ